MHGTLQVTTNSQVIEASLCLCHFLSHVSTAMLTRDIDIAVLSVRPSVCHAPVLYQNGLIYQ